MPYPGKIKPRQYEELKALWSDQDITATAIAKRFGISVPGLLALARRIGLRRRIRPNRLCQISTLLEFSLEEKVRARAEERGITVSTYLRALIKKDFRS